MKVSWILLEFGHMLLIMQKSLVFFWDKLLRDIFDYFLVFSEGRGPTVKGVATAYIQTCLRGRQ